MLKNEIEFLLKETWGFMDPGQVQIVANVLLRHNFNKSQMMSLFEQVMLTKKKSVPELADFYKYLPKRKNNDVNLSIFGITFPSGELLDRFNQAYQKADYEECVFIVSNNDWGSQQFYANRLVEQLTGMFKLKLVNKEKYRSHSDSSVFTDYLKRKRQRTK